MPRSRDTTPEADAVALAGIRSRHPDYDERTARWALFRMLVGDELFIAP